MFGFRKRRWGWLYDGDEMCCFMPPNVAHTCINSQTHRRSVESAAMVSVHGYGHNTSSNRKSSIILGLERRATRARAHCNRKKMIEFQVVYNPVEIVFKCCCMHFCHMLCFHLTCFARTEPRANQLHRSQNVLFVLLNCSPIFSPLPWN